MITRARLALMARAIFSLILISLLFGLAWSPLLTQAGPTLPPRTVPPAGPDDDDGGGGGGGPLLSYIELQVQGAPLGAWSVVQWQDPAGGWHDVEGWRSVLPASGHQRWAVEAKDFKTGPFRWAVTRGRSGLLVGTSNSFNLPGGANETLRVTVSVN